MPTNFPEVWVGRVEKKLTNTDQAPWLDGIAEIDTPVVSLGEGTDSEKNIINIPTSDFEPTVLINNTTYPLALEEYSDDTAVVSLDKYQTAQTSISDDSAMGASYDKVDSATKSHTTSILKKKYGKAIHALAPSSHTTNTPVIITTGEDDGTGRKRLTRKDINALKKQFDELQIPALGRRLVLSSDHSDDIQNFDQKFADQFYNLQSGKVYKIAGFEIYEYVNNPYFNATTGVKKAFGAIPTAGTDFQASVAFYDGNVAKKTGSTKQYFSPAKSDTATQSNKLNYRHYFICVPKRNMYIGAIASGKI